MSEIDDQGVRNAVAFVPATSIQMRFSDDEGAKFDRWLAKHDAEVAATERQRIATALAEDAATWRATAERLHSEGEYIDATRYSDYATARRGVAAEVRRGPAGRGNPEPSES